MTTRIRVPLIGTGTQADPLRADLPNYALIAADTVNAIAVVDIPDADLPAHPGLRVALTAVTDLAPAAQLPLPLPLRAIWRAHLDARFTEHAGQYTPDRK